MDELLENLVKVVSKNPGLTGREYTRILRLSGFENISKHEVNNNLYGFSNLFEPNLDTNLKPAWILKSGSTSIMLHQKKNEVEIESSKQIHAQDNRQSNLNKSENNLNVIKEISLNDHFSWSRKLNLYGWQIRALNNWQNNSYRGIIEAVTGSGKTRVALAAMDAHLKLGWKVVIIVPVVELMNQWDKSIRQTLIGELGGNYKIGYLGNGYKQSLRFVDILIAISNSAQKYNMMSESQNGLLIADECHHYGTESSRLLLENTFKRRIGLTALLEREDSGVEEIIEPYFGKFAYQLDYTEALDEGVIAQFKIVFIAVDMYENEKSIYDELSTEITRLSVKLKKKYPELEESTESFFLNLTKHYSKDPLIWAYIKKVSERNGMLKDLPSKLSVLTDLVETINLSNGCFGFTQTVSAANRVKALVNRYGVSAEIMTGELNKELRRNIFASFETKKTKMIIAPKLLDEGIDVPTADLAIITGMSKSKRQIIQRIGRVVRRKDNNRFGKIIIIISRDTIDDPIVSKTEQNYQLFIEGNIELKRFEYSKSKIEMHKYLKCW